MIKIISLFILLTAYTMGCDNTENENGSNEQASASNTTLHDQTWQLVMLDGEPVQELINEQVPHIRFFSEDSTVSGRLGCNQFGGRYELLGKNEIKMTRMYSTKKACADMKAESIFLPQAEKINRYNVHGDTLWLMVDDKRFAGLKSI